MQIPWYIGWPVAAALGVAMLYAVASRAAYCPLKYPYGLWELQPGLGAEDARLLTSDGVRLHGWWIVVPQAPLVTLYFHGNAGNITHRAQQILEITAAGSSIFLLDYRGYGKSEAARTKRASTKMPRQDTVLARSWVSRSANRLARRVAGNRGGGGSGGTKRVWRPSAGIRIYLGP